MSTTAVGTSNRLRAPIAAGLTSRTALAALVVALVVGILGMHALASHGAPAAPAAAASSITAMPGMTTDHDAAITAGASLASYDHVAGGPHPSTAVAGTSVDAESGSGHDIASMAMLCVVMLAATALTLLVLLLAAVVSPLTPTAFQPAVVRERALQWVRDTGPPHEWQFSVIRC